MESQGVIDSREIRKEARRRGNSQRKVALDDFVLELPDIQRNDGNIDNIPILSPPRIVEESEKRILDKHKEFVTQRIGHMDDHIEYDNGDVESEDRDVNGDDDDSTPEVRHENKSKKMKTNAKPKSKSKSKTKTLYIPSTGKMIKHSVFKEKRKNMRSRSIKLNYKRVPSNKAKLIYIDVISQMIKDYLRDNEVINKFIEEVNESSSDKKKRKRRGNKEEESDKYKEIVNNCQNIIRDYFDRINEYFGSLIDLRLSNGLIRNDITRMNNEKNQLRNEIFQIRQERNKIGLEMKQTRDELQKLNIEYNNREELYKKLKNIQNGIEFNDDESKVDYNDIKYKIDRIEEMKINKSNVLNMIREINKQLEMRIEN